MTEEQNEELAFPGPAFKYQGLTKREYFAAAALPGVLSCPEIMKVCVNESEPSKAIVSYAYLVADAMIELGAK